MATDEELLALSDAIDMSEMTASSPQQQSPVAKVFRLASASSSSASHSAAAMRHNVPWNPAIASKVLRDHFGFDSFRPFQPEIVRAVLSGKDVLGLLATGSGKSLTY